MNEYLSSILEFEEAGISSVRFEEISDALHNLTLPSVDLVVGIGSGGIVFASMVAYKLQVPMKIVWISYRAPDHEPLYPSPRLCETISLPLEIENILLVDDVAVSGKTLETAKEILGLFKVTTLVLKGTADIVLFPDIKTCVHWPWNPPKPIDE